MGCESDLIEVEVAEPTRPIASRAGRVTVPPRRLEQELSAAATGKGHKTTVTARKEALEEKNESHQDSNGNTKLGPVILEAIQTLAKTTAQRIDRQEELIAQQGRLHEITDAQLRAIRDEQKAIRDEQKAIRDEQKATNLRLEAFHQVLDTLTNRLDTFTARFDQLGTQVTTAAGTYADALKSGLGSANTGTRTTATSQGTPVTQICSMNPSNSASQQNIASSPYVVIDLSQAEQQQILAAEKPGKIRRWIDEALQEQDATRDVKCDGISRSPRDSNKFRVFFKDEATAQVIRANDSWLQERFRGTRLQAEQWYPVRVDSVYKGGVLTSMEGAEPRPEAAPMIAKENEVQVHKLQWLSKADVNKVHGSLVLYLGSRQDAEKLLRKGLVEVDGEAAFARPYERRTGPQRCFNCHQFGHVKLHCTSPHTVCSRCAGPGHTHRDCTSTPVRCATCGGPHSTFDSNCRLYRAACEQHQSRRS